MADEAGNGKQRTGLKENRRGKELLRKDIFFGTELNCETKNKILYSAAIGKFSKSRCENKNSQNSRAASP
ncbi:MAG: hypothetical protein ACI4PP_03675 [Clostridia bacterium]